MLHVLASEMRSFKIAEAMAPYGTLVHDRQAAIVVDKQLKADMVPVKLRIRGVPGAPRSEWNVELANHRLLTPSLAFSAIFSALGATASDNTDVVFKIKSRVTDRWPRNHRDRRPRLHRRGRRRSAVAVAPALVQRAVGRVRQPVRRHAHLEHRARPALRFERDVLDVVDVMVPSEEVDPGKTVNVYVTLRNFDESEQTKIIPVRIPESAAGD